MSQGGKGTKFEVVRFTTIKKVMRNTGRVAPVYPKQKSTGRYLTAAEVAERYGRPIGWVYTCKKLPRRKIGKYLTFLEDDLIKFEEYRSDLTRGFIMRPDEEATKLQIAKKRLKFDCF